MPPVTSVVARWGRALGTACRRVCFLPRDRRGRRRGGSTLSCTVGHTPRWVPAVPSCKRNLFRCDSQSIIISELAAPARPARCCRVPGAAAADAARTRERDRPPAPGANRAARNGRTRPFCFSNPFTLPDSGAITHGPIVSKPWCAVSRLQRTVPVATARTRHTRISSTRPRRARRAHRTALTSGPPERRLAHAHKFECALGHGRSPTSQHFTPACQHWGFRLRLASATPQGAPPAAAADSLSLF